MSRNGHGGSPKFLIDIEIHLPRHAILATNLSLNGREATALKATNQAVRAWVENFIDDFFGKRRLFVGVFFDESIPITFCKPIASRLLEALLPVLLLRERLIRFPL